jgi:hypothetical protein
VRRLPSKLCIGTRLQVKNVRNSTREAKVLTGYAEVEMYRVIQKRSTNFQKFILQVLLNI